MKTPFRVYVKSVGKIREEWIGFAGLNETAFIIIKTGLLFTAIAVLFYDSVFALPFFIPFIFLFLKQEGNKLKQKQTEKLVFHFKEMLLSMVAALKAGYSVENAFAESYKDLKFRFGEADLMVKELQKILRQSKNGIPVEKLLLEFAADKHVDAVTDFATIFAIAKRSGGDMARIMERTVSILTRQMEMKDEIRLLIAAKRYEQRIMDVVPLGILLYIRLTNPGYFHVLYHNLAGICIMTAGLLIYAAAYGLSERILEIA